MSKEEPLTMREILTGHEHTRQRGTNMVAIFGYENLLIDDIKIYEKVLEAAKNMGGKALANFKDGLAYLDHLAKTYDGVAELHEDVMANSFYFRIYREANLRLDGGLVLQDGEWSVHT